MSYPKYVKYKNNICKVLSDDTGNVYYCVISHDTICVHHADEIVEISNNLIENPSRWRSRYPDLKYNSSIYLQYKNKICFIKQNCVNTLSTDEMQFQNQNKYWSNLCV